MARIKIKEEAHSSLIQTGVSFSLNLELVGDPWSMVKDERSMRSLLKVSVEANKKVYGSEVLLAESGGRQARLGNRSFQATHLSKTSATKRNRPH